MITKEKVRKEIKVKFGSLSKFAVLAKKDEYTLRKRFARKEVDQNFLMEINRLCERTAIKNTPGEISSEQIVKLDRALKKAGGVITFCREHTEFPEKSVYQILSGRRKRITDKVRDLLDHFKIT